ncbi:hypothetical protein [Ramlibacter aurantiacus]|uniref:hypothetical protein n=1 Tax=Ramlibacter aurantiacus TaxID=2801330 RepID=UPI0019181023|nr:hypothetical protein [Ramlibacter aurantiacus]
MPQDELVARRLMEVEFADPTARIQALVGTGELRKAKGLLKVLEAEVADHLWLAGKLSRLRSMLEDDAAMAMKEMKFSMYRTANRLVAKSEAAYGGSETDGADVPAFFRRKARPSLSLERLQALGVRDVHAVRSLASCRAARQGAVPQENHCRFPLTVNWRPGRHVADLRGRARGLRGASAMTGRRRSSLCEEGQGSRWQPPPVSWPPHA